MIIEKRREKKPGKFKIYILAVAALLAATTAGHEATTTTFHALFQSLVKDLKDRRRGIT